MLSKILLIGGGVLLLGIGAGVGVVALNSPNGTVDPVELVGAADPIQTSKVKFGKCRGARVPLGFTAKNPKRSAGQYADWEAGTLKKKGVKHALSNAQKFLFRAACIKRRSKDAYDVGEAEQKCVSAGRRSGETLLGCNFGERNGFVYVVKAQQIGSEKQYQLDMHNNTHEYRLEISGEQAKATLSGVFSSYMGKVPKAIVAVATTPQNVETVSFSDSGDIASTTPLPRKKLTLKGCDSPVQTLKGMPLKGGGTTHTYTGKNASQNGYTSALRKGKLTIARIAVNCKKLTRQERLRLIYISNMQLGAKCEKAKQDKNVLMCQILKTGDGLDVLAAQHEKKGWISFRFMSVKTERIIEVIAASKLKDQKIAAAKFKQVVASFVNPM